MNILGFEILAERERHLKRRRSLFLFRMQEHSSENKLVFRGSVFDGNRTGGARETGCFQVVEELRFGFFIRRRNEHRLIQFDGNDAQQVVCPLGQIRFTF